MVHQAIRTLIVSDGTVAGIVGTKVYAFAAPQGTALPYITFFVVDDIPVKHMTCTGTGSVDVRVQVDCWSTNYEQVKTLSLAVRNALVGAFGTYNNTVIQGVLSEGSRDTYEQPESAKEQGVYGVSEDYIVWSRDISVIS